MKLEEIIKKSRKLLDKLYKDEESLLTKEDFFMLSISLFIAKKESIIKKNSKTNTIHFNYQQNRKDFVKFQIVCDTILTSFATINVNIPNLGSFDLTKPNCFDGIDNLIFPFNVKVEIENFNGTQNELNEVKRIIWIYSKLRDSFVHGDKFEFDMDNDLIKVSNSMNGEIMGSFDFKVKISPEELSFLCRDYNNPSETYYNHLRQDKLDKYYYLYNKIYDEPIEKSISRMISTITDEIRYIDDINGLKDLCAILLLYEQLQPKMTPEQNHLYFSKILYLVTQYSKKNKENDAHARTLIEVLSEIMSTNKVYYLALYTHMIFVFSNAQNINTDNLRTSQFKVENDPHVETLKKELKIIVKTMDSLMNPYLDVEKTRDALVIGMNKLISIMKQRNKWVFNNIRNGVEHKNIKISDAGYIEIFDRKNNLDEEDINFRCTSKAVAMDVVLNFVENEYLSSLELEVDDFIEELKNIIGESQTLEKFIKYIETFKKFFDSQEEQSEQPNF